MSVEIIENSEEARDGHGRMWGSEDVELTSEHLAALVVGKCLAVSDGEYVSFITFKGRTETMSGANTAVT